VPGWHPNTHGSRIRCSFPVGSYRFCNGRSDGARHGLGPVYAIVKTVGSGASTGTKVLWIVVILLLPLVGLILWWLLGPKS
jgi:hypothetical protein